MMARDAGLEILSKIEEVLVGANEMNAVTIGTFIQSLHLVLTFLWQQAKD
jgi:hypothetical protein